MGADSTGGDIKNELTRMEEVATFVFANCAGAAREERCDPRQLGMEIKTRLLDEGFQKVRAIGLSEVILSFDAGSRSHVSTSSVVPSVVSNLPILDSAHLDDLTAFQSGFTQDDCDRYYFSHLNSREHCHGEAVQRKWGGDKASPRIAIEFRLRRDVHQGTGALVFGQSGPAKGIQLRPAGTEPLSNVSDAPLAYRGNRDSEPRSALVFPQLHIAEDLYVDLCFCQLETNTQDPRVGTKDDVECSRGVDHRHEQLERLSDQVSKERPTIILGDFNARPGSRELNQFYEFHGFLQVLPNPSVLPRRSRDGSGRLHTFGNVRVDAPNPEEPERKQNWPYSHLRHGILVDHAFVRGFDTKRWHCELTILPLANEDGDDRVSDHRPITLTIYRHNQESAQPSPADRCS